MGRLLRWSGYVVIALLLALLVAALWVWIASEQMLNPRTAGKAEQLTAPSTSQVADAPRQMRVLGCLDCHGDGLRGDLFFDERNIAKIYAPNIALIAARSSDQQLARAIRQGIGIDGRALVIMPSATFSRLGDDELAAVIRAIRALPKGGKDMPPRQLGLLGRLGLVTGKFHTQAAVLADYAHKMPIELGPRLEAGRHLVATRCAECHGPDLTGAEVEPGLNAPDLAIAGAYDLPSFKTLMRTGVPPGNRKLRMMGSVARTDFTHYTDAEIAEIYTYLVARAQKLSG
ncbi:MAG TPA: cytochrome c [Sphingomicrobium sp.]|jgi:mono/diheme cytochrome c family protein|nr:cytochrome c [Sphingomicrobium sp.]